jgi:hypothetical protein
MKRTTDDPTLDRILNEAREEILTKTSLRCDWKSVRKDGKVVAVKFFGITAHESQEDLKVALKGKAKEGENGINSH